MYMFCVTAVMVQLKTQKKFDNEFSHFSRLQEHHRCINLLDQEPEL